MQGKGLGSSDAVDWVETSHDEDDEELYSPRWLEVLKQCIGDSCTRETADTNLQEYDNNPEFINSQRTLVEYERGKVLRVCESTRADAAAILKIVVDSRKSYATMRNTTRRSLAKRRFRYRLRSAFSLLLYTYSARFA